MLKETLRAVPGLRTAARPVINFLNTFVLNEGGTYGAWRSYDKVVSALRATRASGAFTKAGYHKGEISEGLVMRWLDACAHAEKVPYTIGQENAGYVAVRSAKVTEDMKGYFNWYDPRNFDQNLIQSTIAELDCDVRQCLGGNWNAVNFKVVRSVAGAPDVGMYEWHTDHFPENFCKLLIYLNGATEASGSTEIRAADGTEFAITGKPGAWALFNANLLWHRGRPVVMGERILVELTVTRALSKATHVGYGGVNSCYPRYPWTLAKLEASGNALSESRA
jgi:hypothetical protein